MKDKTTKRNRLLIVSVLLILLITLTPGNGKMGGSQLDKIAHFIIFFFLSINLCFKYQNPKILIKALLFAVLFGFLTEVLQQFIPGRNLDFYDALADTIGVIFGYFLYQKFKSQTDKLFQWFGV